MKILTAILLFITSAGFSQGINIYTKNNFNTDFFHASDTALTFTNGEINFASTTNKVVSFALKNNAVDTFFHNYERWEVDAVVRIDSLAKGDAGFFIGDSAYGNGSLGVKISTHPTVANQTIGTLINNNANLTVGTGSIIKVVRGDVLLVSVKRDRNKLIASYSKSCGTAITWQIFIDQPGTSYSLPSVRQTFSIKLFQGKFSIIDFTVKYPDANLDLAFVGNSITVGGAASPYYDSAWVQTVRHTIPSVTIMAGSSATTLDIVKTLPSIIKGLPHKAVLLIGTNDFSKNINIDTIKSNYTKIVDTLVAHNITPILVSVLPRTDRDLRSFNSWIQTTFPCYQYVDFFTGMADSGGYRMKTIYSYGDALPHPNNAGHAFMANQFLQVYSQAIVKQ